MDVVRELLSGGVAVLLLPSYEHREGGPAAHQASPSPGHEAHLRVDERTRRVTWGGRDLPLTSLEFDLLSTLAREPDRVWPYEELTEEVWRQPFLGDTEAIRSLVKRVRRKLRHCGVPTGPLSVRGIGLRLPL